VPFLPGFYCMMSSIEVITPVNIDSALEELGWSKKKLAKRLGVWPETVSRWGTTKEVPRYAMEYLSSCIAIKRLYTGMVVGNDGDTEGMGEVKHVYLGQGG
jgi:ribosome-binding protein aMBF1 (putative translation factor)